MLCWLAFGDHEALTSDISTSPKMVLTQGKPTTLVRIFPTGSRGITLRGPPLGGPEFAGSHLEIMRFLKVACQGPQK